MIELFPRAFDGMPSRKAAGGVSLFSGSYPTTVAALNGWSLASPWTVLHNFTSATIGPSACASATGSETLNLIKLGSDNTATLEAVGQSGYAAQGGYTVNTNQDFMYTAPAASWKFSATVPTAYLLTLKFIGTPANGQTFLGGSDGAGGGWWLEAHSTSGIRAAVGSGGGYVNTSYVGGTSLYDGEYHTIMLVIDDAAGKAKIFTEFGNTESTGLTLASGSAYYTLGPVAAGFTWTAPVTYLLSARGEHPLLYTNAQSLFDEYEDARLNNVNQTAIAGLPTSLSDLNSAAGYTFTNAYNFSASTSLAPMTGSAGPSLSPYTGTMVTAVTGTQPTLTAAPQIRTSFTSQTSVAIDSAGDNLWGTGAMPHSTFTMVGIVQAPVSHPGGTKYLMAVNGGVASTNLYRIYSAASNQLTLQDYRSFSGTVITTTLSVSPMWSGSQWNTFAIRRGADGGTSYIKMGAAAGQASATNTGTLAANDATEGGIGRPYQSVNVNEPLTTVKWALWAWGTDLATDAAIDTMVAALRWRYGL